jgi:AraC family transcriptional regulator
MVRTRQTPEPASRMLRRLDFNGIKLTEGIHASGSTLPWHDHGGPTLCFVLHGAFAEYMHGHVIDCRPSTFKITPAGERHWNRFHLGDVRGLLVEVDPESRVGLEPFARVLARAHHSEGSVESLLARRLYSEFLAEDEAAPLAMEGLLLELLASVARSRGSAEATIPTWVQRALGMLQDAPSQRRSLAGIAAEVGVHPATLARAFRRAYGCTLGQMQRRLRLNAAAQQLSASERSLAAIAQEAGFFDQSHFTNAFRRHLGTSPLRYRQATRRHVRAPTAPRPGPA